MGALIISLMVICITAGVISSYYMQNLRFAAAKILKKLDIETNN